MTSRGAGLFAILIAAAVMWVMPSASVGSTADLGKAGDALRDVTAGVGDAVQGTVDKTVAKTNEAVRRTRAKAGSAVDRAKQGKAATRATATDPKTQPPLHGSNPHGQGGVTVVDTDPSSERPLASDPSGRASGEEAIVGRARGEQVNGTFRGHITILALLGNEVAGVDTGPGETKNGPLQPVQTGVLDPLCTGLANQVCLSVLTANSTSTASGSTNDFAIARASVLGLGVGAAESQGVILQDANCQTAGGSSKAANVTSSSGTAVASAANSSSTSRSCRGQAPVVTNTSSVIGLGGVGVPLPAAGCANGTPDTVTGLPGVLPIVCNADDVAGAAAVREALDVFVLQVGGMSLAKETTAASESFSVAPPETSRAQCSDGADNDGDGAVDAADPGCHTDGDPTNMASFNPNDNDETNSGGGGGGGGGSGGSGDDDAAQCSDGRDNDGDGRVDSRDGGCHTDGNPNNAESFDPSDDDESGGGDGGGSGDGDDGAGAPTGGQDTDASELPFTGADVVGLALAGLLMLAGGLLLRRREDAHAAH